MGGFAYQASFVGVCGPTRSGFITPKQRPAVRVQAMPHDTVRGPQEAYHLAADEDTFSSLAQSLREAVSPGSSTPPPTPAPSTTLSLGTPPAVPDTPPTPAVEAPSDAPAFDLPDIYPLGKPTPTPRGSAVEGGSINDLFSGFTKSLNKAVEGVKEGVSSAAGGVKEGVSSAADSLSQSATSITSGGTDAVSDITGGATGAVNEAVGDLKGAVGASVDSLTKTLGSNVDSVTKTLGSNVDAVTSSVNNTVEALGSQLGASVDSVNAAVNAAVGGAVGGATAAAGAAATQVYDALPPPVQDVLRSAGPQAQAASEFAAANPAIAAGVAAGAVIGPVGAWYTLRYGGYSGDMSPSQTFQLLQNEQAMLVDVRSDERRAAEGVPELRRGARGKGVALPPQRVTSGTQRLVRGVSDLEVGATAAIVAGLTVVNPATKVVIMDNKGEVAIKLARALRKEGVFRTYAMQGGFAAWSAADLPTEKGNSNYEVNALEALTEEAEALLQSTQESIVNAPPTTVATYGAAALAVVVAVINYHTTLQFIGVAGTLGIAINWFTSFDTPEEAFADISDKYNKIANTTSKVAGAAKGLQSKLPSGGGSTPPDTRENKSSTQF